MRVSGVVQILLQVRLTIRAIVLVEPGRELVPSSLAPEVYPWHDLQCKIRVNVGGILLVCGLHGVVQILEGASAFQHRSFTIDFGELVRNLVDGLAISQDCKGQSQVLMYLVTYTRTLTMKQSRGFPVHCDRCYVLGRRLIGGRFPNLVATPIKGQLALLGIKNAKVSTPEGLHEGANENVNSLDVLLGFQVVLDVLHRVLGGVLAVLELGEVEAVVAGDVAGHVLGVAGVDQELLPVGHEGVVAQVAADDNVAAFGELAQLVHIGGVALDDGDVGGGAQVVGEFAGIATEPADLNVWCREKMLC